MILRTMQSVLSIFILQIIAFLPFYVEGQIIVQGSGSNLIDSINSNTWVGGQVEFLIENYNAPFLMNTAVNTKLPLATIVTIKSANTTAPLNLSDCYSLAIIKFTATGNLNFANSVSNTYSGVTLIPDGTTRISSILPLNFINCCIMEQASGLSSSQPFISAATGAVSFQNCLIYKTFEAPVFIGSVLNFNLASSILFYQTNTTAKYPIIFLHGSADDSNCNNFASAVSATFNGLTVYGGNYSTGALAPILVVTRYNSVTFSNMVITNLNNNFDQSSALFSPDSKACSKIAANGSFILMNIGTVTLGNWQISSSYLESTATRTTAWTFIQIHNFGSLNAASSTVINNLTWVDGTTATNEALGSGIVQIVRGSMYATTPVSTYPSVQLLNSNLTGVFLKVFAIYNSASALTTHTPQKLNNFVLPSIVVDTTSVAYALTIFGIGIFRYKDGIDASAPPTTGVSLSLVKVLNSQLSCAVVSFTMDELTSLVGDLAYSIESYPFVKIDFVSVVISNSAFSKSPKGYQFGPVGLMLICESAHFTGTNFQISGNNFNTTAVIKSQGVVGNILFTKAQITNNEFYLSSIIYQEEQHLTAKDYHKNFFPNTSAIYALVRPMFISDILSQGNTFTLSNVFKSSAPYLLVNNAIFNEYQLNQSTIISGGNFQPATTDELAELTFSTNSAIVATTQSQGAGGITMASVFNTNFLGTALTVELAFFIKIEGVTFSSTMPLYASSLISVSNYQASSFVYMTDLKTQGLSTTANSAKSYSSIVTLRNVNYARIILVKFSYLAGGFILVNASSISQQVEFTSNVVSGSHLSVSTSFIPKAMVIVDQITVLSVVNNTFTNISIPYVAVAIGNLLEGGGAFLSSNTLTNSQGFGFLEVETSYLSTLTMTSNTFTNFSRAPSIAASTEVAMVIIKADELQGIITISSNSFSAFQLDYNGLSTQPLSFFLLTIASASPDSQIVILSNQIQNGSVSSKGSAMGAFLEISASSALLNISQNTLQQVNMFNSNNFINLVGTNISVDALTVKYAISDTTKGLIMISSQATKLANLHIETIEFLSSEYGAALSFFSGANPQTATDIDIQNLFVASVSGGSGGIISIIGNGVFVLSFISVDLTNNNAIGPIIALSYCTIQALVLQSVEVYTASTAQSSVIMGISYSNSSTTSPVRVQNLTLYEGSGSSSVLFSTFEVDNFEFSGNAIQTTDASQIIHSSYLYQTSGNVTITEQFQNLYLGGPSWIILDCDGSNDLSAVLNGVISSDVTISNNSASFIELNGASGNCSLQLNIIGSNFSEFNKLKGNGGVIASSKTSTINVTIDECNFQNNQADSGAVFYSVSDNTLSEISLRASNFTLNHARVQGGVLYAPLDYTTVYDGCKFDSNTAHISGACFYVSVVDKQAGRLTNGSIFINSRVDLSKQVDIGTGAKYFTFTMDETDLAATSSSSALNPDGTLLITGVTGYSMQKVKMKFSPFDYLDQPYYDYNFANAILFTVVYPVQNSTVASYNCTPDQCYVSSHGLSYIAGAGTTLQTVVSYLLSSGTLYNSFTVQIRNCVVGEIVDPDLKICVMCPENKFSLEITDASCTDCPVGAKCPGGDKIIPEVGYYRSLIDRRSVLPCWTDTESCLGFSDGNCSEGYYGPLCQLCRNDLGYVNTYDGKCKLCGSQALGYSVSIGAFIGNFLFQIWIIYTTWKNNKASITSEYSADDDLEDSGAFLRQLMLFFQIISIVGIAAPEIFENISFLKFLSNPLSGIAFYMECLLLDFGWSAEQILQTEIYILIAAPFVKLALFVLFLGILSLLKKGFSFTHAIIVGTITILTGDQPAMLDGLVSYLNCSPLDTNVADTYVTTYLNVKCETEDYTNFLNTVVYPATFGFHISFPVFLMVVLFLKRKSLHQSQYRMTLGTIYNDFRRETYYWGIVLMCLKMALVMITKVLNVPLVVKSTLILLVLVIYAVIFFRKNPYYSPNVAKCEKVAIISYFLGVIWGILLQQPSDPSVNLIYLIFAYGTTVVATLFILLFIGKNVFGVVKSVVWKLRGKKYEEVRKRATLDISGDLVPSVLEQSNSYMSKDNENKRRLKAKKNKQMSIIGINPKPSNPSLVEIPYEDIRIPNAHSHQSVVTPTSLTNLTHLSQINSAPMNNNLVTPNQLSAANNPAVIPQPFDIGQSPLPSPTSCKRQRIDSLDRGTGRILIPVSVEEIV